jgi:hypothetical protein
MLLTLLLQQQTLRTKKNNKNASITAAPTMISAAPAKSADFKYALSSGLKSWFPCVHQHLTKLHAHSCEAEQALLKIVTKLLACGHISLLQRTRA